MRGPLFIADTLINEDPDEDQLCAIINQVSDFVKSFGVDPKIALVANSDFGSRTSGRAGKMSRVARYKSQDMLNKGYFSHTSPTYGTPSQMIKAFGLSFRTAGENIARGYPTPQAVVNGWMNSSGHRANILNASYTQIGVGYVAQGNYWTQMFIGS